MLTKLVLYLMILVLASQSLGVCGESSEEEGEKSRLKNIKTRKVEVSSANEAEALVWKILVVDDSEFFRKLLVKSLPKVFTGKGKLEIVSVEDGDLALPELMKGSFSLVFMDCRMKRLNGIEATREIRKVFEKLPIIGFSNDDKEKEFVAAGASRFLSKSVVGKEACEALGAILEEFLKE